MQLPQIKQFLKNKSLRNVMLIMSGTFLSQLLPILFFPILSRLYTPADYGVLGIFMSISMLLVVISNLQLNHAILLPKLNEDALSIFSSGLFLVSIFSLFIGCISFLFAELISNFFKTNGYRYWVYFLPFSILLSGMNVQLSSWFLRSGNFKVITKSRVSASVVSILVSLSIVLIYPGPAGLVISYFAGTAANTVVLLWFFENKPQVFRVQSWQCHVKNISTYNQFPVYTLPTELISNFVQQLPIYIFSFYSGVQSVGWFSRSRQMLGLPITYFSSSISEVYKQRASDAFRNNPAHLKPLFLKTFRSLALVAIIPFLVITVFSPDIFALVFGENWRQAGVFTQVLAVMYFFKLVISPLTYNFYLFSKQRLDFLLHILIIIITSAGLFIGFFFFDSAIKALLFFSIAYSIVYVIYGFYSYHFIDQKS